MNKKILIVGSSGQDGTLLLEKLKSEDSEVISLSRNTIVNKKPFEITNPAHVSDLIRTNIFHEIYFLAAHHGSSEKKSNNISYDEYFAVNHQAPVNFIESIRKYSAETKLFFANSSHVFGMSDGRPLSEDSNKKPICFYGLSKYLTLKTIGFYRDNFGLHLVNGILFNHESHLRNEQYLTMKIIKSAYEISRTGHGEVKLGNLEQKVDWGYAPDYIDAITKVLRLKKAEDFVISSGELHTVAEFAEIAFSYFGLNYKNHVKVDTQLIDGVNRGILFGNNRKLLSETNWRAPHSFDQWIKKICNNIASSEILETKK